MTEWIEMCLKGGQIRRFHAWPTIGQETVAEHSFSVAIMVLALTGGKGSLALLKAALYHDISEQATGDVPANVKWSHPFLKTCLDAIECDFNNTWGLNIELTDNDKLVLKWADMLALLHFCKSQRELGNRGMNTVFTRGVEYLRNLTPVDNSKEILISIMDNYIA